MRSAFSSCRVVDRVRNDAGIDNREHGAPIAVCTYPDGSVPALVERARYLG